MPKDGCARRRSTEKRELKAANKEIARQVVRDFSTIPERSWSPVSKPFSSKKTVLASSKLIPCFLRLLRDLSKVMVLHSTKYELLRDDQVKPCFQQGGYTV